MAFLYNLDSQQFLQSFAVKADYHLTIYNGDWCGHHPDLHKLIHRGLVVNDVPYLELDSLLRKKLFRLLTEVSTFRLGVNQNFLGHVSSLLLLNNLASENPLGVV